MRERLFELREEHLLWRVGSASDSAGDDSDRELNPALGRPGMELWSILVLALLKQGINCDLDRSAELANKHLDVRRMLGLFRTRSATGRSSIAPWCAVSACSRWTCWRR